MSKDDSKKYSTSGDEKESEILPNLLGIDTLEGIEDAELEGFYIAQDYFIDELNDRTKFNNKLIYNIHKTALQHLYSFAGKLRTVNISKAGFMFPSARVLPNAMDEFENAFLKPLNKNFSTKNELITAIAITHAELLYIHPFREGNGRTARLFSFLVYLEKTGEKLDFSDVLSKQKEKYIQGVQQATSSEYSIMIELFKEMIKLYGFAFPLLVQLLV